MKVSIIVPIYNSYDYLDKCVNSLINQKTTEKYEIILVNDCSTDDSLTLIRMFEAQYPDLIKVIDSKINLRQGGARNLGIDVASGEYIFFVDSDDYVSDNALQLLCDNDYCYDVIMSNKLISWKGDSSTLCANEVKFNSKMVDVPLRLDMVASNSLCVWNAIYNKEFLDKYNLRFMENLCYEDVCFTFQVMLEAHSIKTIDEEFYYYREDNVNSTSKKANSDRVWEAETTAKMQYEYGRNHKDYALLKDAIDYCYVSRFIIIYYTYSIKRFDPPRYDKIRQGTRVLKEMFPQYEKSAYYKKYYTSKQRLMFKIAKISPKIYYLLNKLMRRI